MHGRPITMEDYLTSRMFFDPLHILDCALEADGANAYRHSAERALKQPVYITSAAQTLGRYGPRAFLGRKRRSPARVVR